LGLIERLREVRIDRFGDGEEGRTRVASALGIPTRTWMNYEMGVTMPAEIMLQLLVETRTNPDWLLKGEGERYSLSDLRLRFSE
jgi:hypothetical protein